ncbi:MAG: hypothetical protein AAF368_08320 [Planctomycetota bacterium]
MAPSDLAANLAPEPGGSALVESAPRTALGRWAERIDDRLNPILVREVRQGLRSNGFRNLFWLTLVLATCSCGFTMAMHGIEGTTVSNGRGFLGWTMGLMRLATGFFVPFVAFQSVSSEWEDRTRDMLQLSGLGSWAIVRGKLVAALMQALLFYCAFLPFLALAFLMRGVDLQEIIVGLNASLASCLVSTTFGIFLASLGRTRTLRVFLFALLAVVLLFWGGTSGVFLSSLGRTTTVSLESIGIPWVMASVPVSYGITFARNRFAHEYENQSTPLRVLTTVLLFAIPLFVLFLAWTSSVTGVIDEGLFGTLLTGLIAISLLFASEGETMSRRVAARVPRSGLRAFLAIPWLPGGGRGLIYFTLHALLLLGLSLAFKVLPASARFSSPAPFALPILSVAALYGFLMIAPSTYFMRNQKSLSNRRVLSILIAFGIPFTGMMVSGFGQMLGRFRAQVRAYDILSIPHVLTAVGRGNAGVWIYVVLGGLALFCLALNFKRLTASVAEVHAAVRENRERSAAVQRMASARSSAEEPA